jgi:hypothetical protein
MAENGMLCKKRIRRPSLSFSPLDIFQALKYRLINFLTNASKRNLLVFTICLENGLLHQFSFFKQIKQWNIKGKHEYIQCECEGGNNRKCAV